MVVNTQELMNIVEALIFAAAEPISLSRIQETMNTAGIVTQKNEVAQVVAALIDKWGAAADAASSFELVAVGEGYAFRTKPQYGSYVRAMLQAKPTKLSPSQLEVLAMVAYRQPVTRLEIDEIRGVDSSGSVRKLLNLKLVKIIGKGEGLGKPLLYGTSKEFLEFFGLSSLHDLPTLKDHQELNKDAQPEQPADLTDAIVADLFAQNEPGAPMFSEETERASQNALDSLEEAMSALVNATA